MSVLRCAGSRILEDRTVDDLAEETRRRPKERYPGSGDSVARDGRGSAEQDQDRCPRILGIPSRSFLGARGPNRSRAPPEG